MNLKIYEKTKYNNIYKHRLNGTYAIDLSLGYDSLGKRIRTTKTGILSEKEAKKILSNEELKRNHKNKIINISKFEDCLDEYYDWCILSGNVKETTLKRKKRRFANHIITFFKGMKFELIGEHEILQWHQYLDSKKLDESTKNTLHKQLSAYFNWLFLHKRIINVNPCLMVSNYKIPKKHIEYRTLEQMNTLWETIKNDTVKSEEVKLRTYAITKCLFFCGFRIGELLGLKISDFNFDILNNDFINVSEIKITLKRTVYYDSNGWVLSDGKTVESLGMIYIGKNAFQPIFDYIKYMNSIGYIFQENDYVFANPNIDKEINVYSLEKIRSDINYFVNKAELPHTKPKDMRSSHGTFLLSNGYSLEEVQTRLRHTKKDTTEKYYATFYEENRKKLAQNIDKFAI